VTYFQGLFDVKVMVMLHNLQNIANDKVVQSFKLKKGYVKKMRFCAIKGSLFFLPMSVILHCSGEAKRQV